MTGVLADVNDLTICDTALTDVCHNGVLAGVTRWTLVALQSVCHNGVLAGVTRWTLVALQSAITDGCLHSISGCEPL